jgi:deferrochelatase/peroxidase EfeB
METIVSYPSDRKEELIKVLSDIAEKDKSFIWSERDNKIVIFSDNRDQAFRRGSWLIHKFDSRISYKVETKSF